MMKKAFLLLSTIAVGAIANEGDSSETTVSPGGNGEVDAEKAMKDYLDKLSKDKKIDVRLIKEKLTAVAHRDDAKVFKGMIDLSKSIVDEVIVVLYQNQEPLESTTKEVEFEKRPSGKTYIRIPLKNLKNSDKVIITNKNNQKLIEYTIIK